MKRQIAKTNNQVQSSGFAKRQNIKDILLQLIETVFLGKL
jgi:hypothetical protein